MIISISLALLISGTLLVLLNNFEIPEIPIYLGSGVLLSIIVSYAVRNNLVSQGFVESEIMRELALLGLSILIFYSTSGTLVDTDREISIKAFKTSAWVSGVSFAIVSGISLYFEYSILESVLFGIAGSIGSTLLDSGLVKEEARKNHIYGWLTENMNFYNDVFGIIGLSILVSFINGINIFNGIIIATSLIIGALISRKIFSDVIIRLTGGENELILLSGISTLICLVWVTEAAGVSALAGVYASGLILVNTELGFSVRERFSAVKDFFLALSFISIGYLLTMPASQQLIVITALVTFTTTIKPIIATQLLKLEGYDLRTSFMSSIQSSQISEIVVVGSLILSPFVNSSTFETIAISFAVTTVIAHLVEDREQVLFEKLFSDYELDSEKSYIPEKLENHVILAGYDWKTRGLEELVKEKVLVADYSLESIEEAKKRNLSRLLADLHSDETWEELNYDDASIIISAIEDQSLIQKIRYMDVDAKKILVSSESEDVKKELRGLLREELK